MGKKAGGSRPGEENDVHPWIWAITAQTPPDHSWACSDGKHSWPSHGCQGERTDPWRPVPQTTFPSGDSLTSLLRRVQLVSGAAPKLETASGAAVCSQFSHLCISQHLSNNELLLPKASSLTKYFFPLHPEEAEAWWLGESSGKMGLCPAIATDPCSLSGTL